MRYTIQVFAMLKNFFDEKFEVDCDGVTIESVLQELILQKPDARSVLEVCRFASGHQFLQKDFSLNDGATLYVIPPSGGG